VMTALSLGLPARYVSNEAHVFVEVWLPSPHSGWMRIDLGGGAEGLSVHGGDNRTLHAPAARDPFDQPSTYAQTYSHQASSGSQGMAGATQVFGLPRIEDFPGQPTGGVSPSLDANAKQKLTAALTHTQQANHSATQAPTRLVLLQASPAAFRGDPISIAGRAETESGRGIANLPVLFFLLPRHKLSPEHAVRAGDTRTDADGYFNANGRIPPASAVGRYELIVVTPGNESHAPAMTQ